MVRIIPMKLQGNVTGAFRVVEPFETACLKDFEPGELHRIPDKIKRRTELTASGNEPSPGDPESS